MTNLSELLPSGGGAKEFSAVASGTLPNGQAVVMRSDGKIEAVSATGGGPSMGTAKQYTTGDSQFIRSFYDTNKNKTVVFYQSAPNYHGVMVEVGVSGTTMTVGTPITFNAGTTYFISCAYDLRGASGLEHGIVVYRNGNQSNKGYLKPIYFQANGVLAQGGAQEFCNNTLSSSCEACWVSYVNYFVIAYGKTVSEGRARVAYGTSQGNITLGGDVQFNSGDTRAITVEQGKGNPSAAEGYVMVAYREVASSYARKARIGLAVANSINFSPGSEYIVDTTYGTEPARLASVDYDNGKVVMAYTPADTGSNSLGTCRVATINGYVITFGSTLNFTTSQENYHIWVAPTGTTNEFALVWGDGNYNTGTGYIILGNVSGTTISYQGGGLGTRYQFGSNAQFNNIVYDSDANAMIISTKENSGSKPNNVIPFTIASSNNTDFIGITAESIANTATGKVNPRGGVAAPSITLITGSTYYVQNDGSLSTTSSSAKAGKAISTTQLILTGAS